MSKKKYKHDKNKKIEKEKFNEIMLKYNVYKLKLEFCDKLNDCDDFDFEDEKVMKDYVNFVEAILNAIKVEFKNIILTEYLKNNSSLNGKTYSRSTYFKMKSAAIKEFLSYVL